jgi:hypothetical protein
MAGTPNMVTDLIVVEAMRLSLCNQGAKSKLGGSRFQIESLSPAAYTSERGYARGGARFDRRHFGAGASISANQ